MSRVEQVIEIFHEELNRTECMNSMVHRCSWIWPQTDRVVPWKRATDILDGMVRSVVGRYIALPWEREELASLCATNMGKVMHNMLSFACLHYNCSW